MGESGRTSKISTIVAALCIVIYVLAISLCAVQIIESIGQRRNLAESEFYDLADRATQSAVFLGFMSEAYQDSIRDFIAGSNTILGVIISGSGGEYAFERFAGGGIVWAGASPRFKSGVFQGEPFYLPLRVDGQRNVNIQAIYSRVDNTIFLRILRNTLLSILAGLAIALITLLVELTRKNKSANQDRLKKTYPAEKAKPEPESMPPTEEEFDYAAGEAHSEDEYDTASEQEDTGAVFDDNSDREYMSSSMDLHTTEENSTETQWEIPEEDAEAEEITEDGEESETNEGGNDFTEKVSMIDAPDDRHPTGLFTPRGNIGWDAYTGARMESELHRCASFEQDLVFLAMELKGLKEPDDALYRRFAEEAVNFFSSRDLIFEKGENGISIIVPNVNLEQGMVKSEEFRRETLTRLNESEGRVKDLKVDFCIGLSSRSGRLMEANRLILEANKALEKALDDPLSPIIAFKSDPEKYREFIKEH